MLIDIDGVNPGFRNQCVELVESITGDYTFKLTDIKGNSPQSLVFECSGSEEEVDSIVPFLKSTIKKSPLGAIMMYRVVPHGQFMWIPKR